MKLKGRESPSNVLECSICLFPYCMYFLQGQFQITYIISEGGLGGNAHSGSPKASGGPRAYGIESLERHFNSLNATLSLKPALVP